MFTMLKKSRNGEYLQVAKNYRDQGRVRQRLILYVGPYASIDEALETLPSDDEKASRLRDLLESNPDLLEKDHARAARATLGAEARAERRERKREARKKAKGLLKGHGSLEEVFRAYDEAWYDAHHRHHSLLPEEEKAAAAAEEGEIRARTVAHYDSLSKDDKRIVRGVKNGTIAGELNRRYNRSVAEIEAKYPEKTAKLREEAYNYGNYQLLLQERLGLAPHPSYADEALVNTSEQGA
jgi:hypothetical protein